MSDRPWDDLGDGWRSFAGGRRWRMTPDGIELGPGEGGEGLVRTRGEPISTRNLWADFGPMFLESAGMYGIGADVLCTIAALESAVDPARRSHRNPKSVRYEPGYVSEERSANKVSYGLCQILLSTARGVAGLTPWGKSFFGRETMFDPRVSIILAGAVLRNRWNRHLGDPLLASAMFNAGGVYQSDRNEFHVRTHGEHRLLHTAQWFNDLVAVLRDDELVAVGYRRLFDLPETSRAVA